MTDTRPVMRQAPAQGRPGRKREWQHYLLGLNGSPPVHSIQYRVTPPPRATPHALIPSRRWNSRHAAATPDASRMALTTQTRVAPASSTESSVFNVMPPIANHGRLTFAAAQRTY